LLQPTAKDTRHHPQHNTSTTWEATPYSKNQQAAPVLNSIVRYTHAVQVTGDLTAAVASMLCSALCCGYNMGTLPHTHVLHHQNEDRSDLLTLLTCCTGYWRLGCCCSLHAVWCTVLWLQHGHTSTQACAASSE
jgi:hypothetical protein